MNHKALKYKFFKAPVIVWISWRDAHGLKGGGWKSRDVAESMANEDVHFETTGFLIAQNKHYWVLAGSIGSHDYGDLTCIPKAVVVRMLYAPVKKLKRLK